MLPLLRKVVRGFLPVWLAVTSWAHVGSHPSVHDTVAGIALRLAREVPPARLTAATPDQLLAWLAPQERLVLGREHVRFTVNVPVRVTVVGDATAVETPFWLADLGFRDAGLRWQDGESTFTAWAREFPAGEIGLGVNGLGERDSHYFVLLQPLVASPALEVAGGYPGRLRVATFMVGAQPWADRGTVVTAAPPVLLGQTLLRTLHGSRNDACLNGKSRVTPFPAGPLPDHLVLTWSGSPTRSQTVQWRTSATVRRGLATFHPKPASGGPPDPVSVVRVPAVTRLIVDPALRNDPVIHWHTAELNGLTPGTTYVYRVGDGSPQGWSAPAEFTTAPEGATPFSFVYMGDAQNGLDRWGQLAQRAYRSRPDAAFYLMAGDLVNRGNQRDDWDAFLHFADGIFARRPLAPVIGNHECQGGHPTMYLEQFALPLNGPSGLEAGRAYAFEYSNALFVILDSNLDPQEQSVWLEDQLSSSGATWKFVAYHHPAYSSAPNRDNEEIRQYWVPIFDRYHVDLALQGHDHAYLRTYPLRDNQRVVDPADGTVYIVSVSGTKMYDQAARPYTEFGMTRVPTYQVLDIQIQGDRLNYRSYDAQGRLRDQFVIRK